MSQTIKDCLFNLQTQRLVWSLKRIIRKQATKKELMDLRLKKALSISKANTPFEIDQHLCLLIPSYRMDGIGIQVLIRIAVLNLARESGTTYIHFPFLEIEHQHIDPDGKNMSQEAWSIIWEKFFNISHEEHSITDLKNSIGIAKLSEKMKYESTVFLDPKDGEEKGLIKLVNKIRGKAKGSYIFSLGLVRQSKECNLYLSSNTVAELQSKFHIGNYQAKGEIYDPSYTNVAIHIRRGDVWDNIKKGNTAKRFTDRLLDEEFYYDLIEKINSNLGSIDRPLRIHIFSDGEEADFGRIKQNQHCFELKAKDNKTISEIYLHLRESTLDSLYYLIKAPILFPAKSTFSVVAIILGQSKVINNPQVQEYAHYRFLDKYMVESNRYINLEKEL